MSSRSVCFLCFQEPWPLPRALFEVWAPDPWRRSGLWPTCNHGFWISVFPFFFFSPVFFIFFRGLLHFQDDIKKFPGNSIMGIRKSFHCTNSLHTVVHNHEVSLTVHFSLAIYISIMWEWGRGDFTCDSQSVFLCLSLALPPPPFRALKVQRQHTNPLLIKLNNNPKLFLIKLIFITKVNFYRSKPQKQNCYCVWFSQLFLWFSKSECVKPVRFLRMGVWGLVTIWMVHVHFSLLRETCAH